MLYRLTTGTDQLVPAPLVTLAISEEVTPRADVRFGIGQGVKIRINPSYTTRASVRLRLATCD